jgi:hypothetical protein
MLVLPFLLVFGAIGVATALAHGPWKIVMAVVFIVALLVPRLMR